MADIDIDPFGEHDKTDSHPDDTGEAIPLPLVNTGGSTCELSLYVKQYSINTNPRCLCISAHSLCSLLFKL